MFTLMVRSASLRVSNHEAEHAAILRDASLRDAPQDEDSGRKRIWSRHGNVYPHGEERIFARLEP